MKNKSAPTILLGDYLSAKGFVKALMKAECHIFGIPFPLVRGWPAKYGKLEITPAMICAVRKHIEGKDSAAVDRTRMALMVLDRALVESEEPTQTQANMGLDQKVCRSALLDGVSDRNDEAMRADRPPPWETDSQCNQSAVDYVRRLLARCERGEVIDVTVIENLPDGTQAVRNANRGRK
jgi:hypothetical protein